jgi:ribosomal protein L18
MLRHLSSEERRTLANRGALKRKNPGKIRLSVFRSDRHIEIQAIDDVKGHTLCAASSKEKISKAKVGISLGPRWLAKFLQNVWPKLVSKTIIISIVVVIYIMVV